MWTQFLIQFWILLVMALCAAVLLGRYIGMYFAPIAERRVDTIGKVERRLLSLLGVDEKKQDQSWVGYSKSLLVVNLLFFIGGYLLLRFQGSLPLNPNGAANLDWSTALHTTISFMTNTDQQHYSGEALSYLSQTFVLGTMLFVAPTMAFTVCIAVIRGLANKPLGNFYADFVRFIFRILLPISLFFGMLMILLGVPQTFSGAISVTTLEGAKQLIYRGPVAAFEVIKQLGNNGGGFFGANGAHPFENPNQFVNFIQMFLMLLIPMSLPVAYGKIIGSAKQGRLFLGVMTILFIMMTFGMAGSLFANPTAHGQELRFGQVGTALYSSITSAAETGAVNAMHDSLHPLPGLIQLGNMMLNVVYGGAGAGFLNVLLYAFVAVFLTGLLIGRTPTFLGKKIETFEVKMIAIALLVPPFLILVCIQLNDNARKLIYRGFRMASRLKAELYVLTILPTAENQLNAKQKEVLAMVRESGALFGAKVLIRIQGERSIAQAITAAAKHHRITQIVLGQSARTRWQEIRRGSIINEIMRHVRGIDIQIVADDLER